MVQFQNLYFLSSYSLPTLVISALVTVIYFFVCKFFETKIPYALIAYIPFLLGVIFNFIYLWIFFGLNSISVSEVLSVGFLCGSLSQVFSAFVKRFFLGNLNDLNAVTLIIEENLGSFIKKELLTVCVLDVKSLICSHINDDDKILSEKVYALVLENCHSPFNEQDLLTACKLTVTSVKAFLDKHNFKA